MTITINRGPITLRLLDELKELNLPVGDNATPEDPHGWQGEPDADGSNFIPWVVLTPGTAPAGTGTFAESAEDWRLPYTVFYAGVSRDQVEWLADKMRSKFVDIEREVITTDSGDWKILQLRCTSLGGTTRVGTTFPDYFTQADLYEVWLSKEI